MDPTDRTIVEYPVCTQQIELVRGIVYGSCWQN